MASIDLSYSEIEKKNIIEIIILSKLEKSKSEIRRLIKSNGVKINNEIVTDEKFVLNQDILDQKFLKLSIGKKRHLKIEIKN